MMDFEQAQMWRRLSNQVGNYYSEAAKPEQAKFREFVRGLLLEGQITVEFEKANGEIRAMICTLNESKGAKYTNTTEPLSEWTEKKSKNLEHVQKVWDCNVGAWRSFRWDRLRAIEFSI